MAAKKTAKKKAAKKVASAAPAPTPREHKSFQELASFLRSNPEFAIALHKHYEDKMFQLNRAGWSVGMEYSDTKHVWGSQFITAEILDEFNFYDLVRN